MSLLAVALLASPAIEPAPASAAAPASGPELTVEAQLRPRVVAHTGRDFGEDEDTRQMYVTQRARLGVTLSNPAGLAVIVRLQDVRAWGEETHPLNDFGAGGFDAHEAYLRVPFCDGWKLQLGRQEISFDNQRLVGAVNWRQSGQAFDAGRLGWAGEGWDADVFLAVIGESAHKGVVDSTFTAPLTDDILLGGLHGHHVFDPAFELSASYYMRKNDAIDELRHTAGVFAKVQASGFRGQLDGYYQMGDLGDASISAYLAGLRAGWDFGGELAPFVQAFADVVSGKAGKPEKAFDTLYATNHMYYGELDYFLALPKHTGGLGLMDVGGRVSLKPHAKVTTGLDFHLFQAMDESPSGDKGFGQEVDARVDWKAQEALTVALLYGVFLPGDLMKTPGHDTPEHAVYLTTDLAF